MMLPAFVPQNRNCPVLSDARDVAGWLNLSNCAVLCVSKLIVRRTFVPLAKAKMEGCEGRKEAAWIGLLSLIRQVQAPVSTSQKQAGCMPLERATRVLSFGPKKRLETCPTCPFKVMCSWRCGAAVTPPSLRSVGLVVLKFEMELVGLLPPPLPPK